ncbi:MAG: hypothetical protein Q8S02_08755 [Hydrogenophaga sp.]|nr:hypothetical protein [Hydrogenophaga sp.]
MADDLFNEDERDVLGETVNVAMGKAGAKLADAFSGFVQLRVPELRSLSAADFFQVRARLAETYERISVIQQEFFGELAGSIAVIYGPASYAALRDVLGFDDRDGDSRQQREELLLELGNALASTCVLEIAELLELRTGLRAPQMVTFDCPTPEASWNPMGLNQPWEGQTLQIDIVFFLEANEVPFELMITVLPDRLPVVKQALAKRL